jgi:FkbM family methyltransferase
MRKHQNTYGKREQICKHWGFESLGYNYIISGAGIQQGRGSTRSRMTYFNDFQGGVRGVSPRVLYFVIAILLGYITLDFLLHHSGSSECVKSILDAVQEKPNLEEVEQEDAICKSVEGHLTTEPQNPDENPWNQMKWVGEPARCKVKGHLIESLDPKNNFRRGFSLRFAHDVEDKTHVLPYLLGSKVDLNRRSRRVYLDLGANSFGTSIMWFMRMYPCDFSEVHAFEVDRNLLRIPETGFNESANWKPENPWAIRVNEVPGIPAWMLNRMTSYNYFVADIDDTATESINITRFMKEDLMLRASDTVVVKMDIEGAEWPILKRWMDDPEMAEIIDELFVEIHYKHPSMLQYHWGKFDHTREQATQLIAGLRSKGFFIHAWP